MREGWAALRVGLEAATDDLLETDRPGHPHGRGDRAVASLLHEVSHHGTQICVLRDLQLRRR